MKRALSQSASVNYQVGTRDPLRHVTGEKQDSACNVVRSAEPTQWSTGRLSHKFFDIRTQLPALACQHRRVDIARANTVHAYVVSSMVDGHRPCQVQEAGFCSAVRRCFFASFQ